MKSRMTFAREKEAKDQDLWNNEVWIDYLKSELSEHQTKYRKRSSYQLWTMEEEKKKDQL